jgi:hypothetical protein
VVGRVCDGSAGGNESGENVNLAPRRPRQGDATQVPVSHANRSTAAIHSARPSIGIR